MTTYRTQDGDVLDAICWKYYGRETATVEVLKANPGLSEYGPVLPAGLAIVMPDITPPANEPVSLWN